MITDIAPPQHRAEILGHMSIASIFSMALGPMVGVTIFTRFGMPYLFGLRDMFMIAAGIGIAAALFFMLTIQSQVGRSMRWTLFGKQKFGV